MLPGSVNSVLYCVQFSRDLDERQVRRIGRMLIEEPFGGLTAEEEYAEIAAAVRTDPWTADLGWQPHTEGELRDFLRRLLRYLDTVRPWPEPPFRELDTSRWPEFRTGTPLARVRIGPPAGDRLSVRLRVPEGGGSAQVLLLRLRTGDEVALAAPPFGTGGDRALLLAPEPHRPAPAVVAAFRECTGRPEDGVALLRGPAWWRRRAGRRLRA